MEHTITMMEYSDVVASALHTILPVSNYDATISVYFNESAVEKASCIEFSVLLAMKVSVGVEWCVEGAEA